MKVANMASEIAFFGSLQSPYCYFSLDRLEDMMRDLKVQVILRVVLPGLFAYQIPTLIGPGWNYLISNRMSRGLLIFWTFPLR